MTAFSPIGSYVLGAAASEGQSVVANCARALRHVALSAGWDPACCVTVAGLERPIVVPLSHAMPLYRAKYPQYDRLPTRVARHVRQRDGRLCMIDIGANVGDTILATEPAPGDSFLAVEPHPAFLTYLRRNVVDLPVRVEACACGGSETMLTMGAATRGTASLSGASTTLTVACHRLDTLWQQVNEPVNFLKIDTDGYDVDVLQGASMLLRHQLPWLLYECDPRLTAGGLNPHVDMLKWLNEAGYGWVLAYDNFGVLIAPAIRLDAAPTAVEQALSDGCIYLDLLVLPDTTDARTFATGEL